MNLLDKDSLRNRFLNYLADTGMSLREVSNEVGVCLPVVQRFYKNDGNRPFVLRTMQKFHIFLKGKGY